MTHQGGLWESNELPEYRLGLSTKNFNSLKYPLWSQNKARLIQTYLRLFMMVTKHGAYIDGFAAPQNHNHLEAWSARLVLEMEPKWFRSFWLCDIDARGIEELQKLAQSHATRSRRISVISGDFNETYKDILKSGLIKEKTATFALLDQRTFECSWSTVEGLAAHKAEGNKIEQFYFFPTGWIDRSLAAVSKTETEDKVARWWGNSNWRSLQGMDSIERAHLVASRFERELGYGKAAVFPIHSKSRGGRVMYDMIHASDHPEAFPFMVRAYRKVSGHPDFPNEIQLDLLDCIGLSGAPTRATQSS